MDFAIFSSLSHAHNSNRLTYKGTYRKILTGMW